MLKTYKIAYEIYDTDTEEVLMDNLSLKEAMEQVEVYNVCFGAEISVAIRETHRVHSDRTREQEYKATWISYFAELSAMGNLY